MTQLHVPERPPSWLMPIAVTAMATVLVQWIPFLLAGIVPQLACGTMCCCGIGWVPIGALAALLVMQRDPMITPGQGFAVSFIASGIGSLLSAVFWVVQLHSADPAVLEQDMREILDESNRQLDPAQRLSADQIDDTVASMVDALPYVPVIMAIVYTALAGVAGLFTVLLLRRRARLPMPPPPPA